MKYLIIFHCNMRGISCWLFKYIYGEAVSKVIHRAHVSFLFCHADKRTAVKATVEGMAEFRFLYFLKN